jgi:hypothetical protein
MKVYIIKSKGRYNLISDTETWSLQVRVYGDDIETLNIYTNSIDEEPDIELVPPSEIASAIEEENSKLIWGTTAAAKRKTDMEKFRQIEQEVDKVWAQDLIEQHQRKIEWLKQNFS